MQVYVELPEELDVDRWALRHAADEVPDHSPYGLHHMASPDCRVRFRRPIGDPRAAALGRKVRDRLQGTEVLAGVAGRLGRRGRAAAQADVVLCMDKRTGVPAALLPGGPPVVMGAGWLEDPEKLPGWEAKLTRRALLRSTLFTLNPTQGPRLAALWRLPAEQVHEVTFGIDTDFFAAQSWPEGSDTVTAVGDDPMRDHDTLVDALQLVRQRGRSVNLELASTLPVTVPRELGTLHARRMEGQMRCLYRKGAVVATALHPNTSGSGLTSVVEAMASARPVVATDNPGMSHYVSHGETGLLVPPHDPACLAQAIGELLADPARAHAMGHAGRQRVERYHSSRSMAAQLRCVLRQAAGPSAGTSGRGGPRAD